MLKSPLATTPKVRYTTKYLKTFPPVLVGMNELDLKGIGLTDGEIKVYLTLLELGSSTTGPIIDKSGVARSFIYNILEKLLEKGLISYTVKEKTKYYHAADPNRIFDYIEKKKEELDAGKEKIAKIMPMLLSLRTSSPKTEIQVYEGFAGLQTASGHYFDKCKKGDEAYAMGIYYFQEEKYHEHWQYDHKERVKRGIKIKLLFNKGTDRKILENRNSFKDSDARYMNSDIQTESWFMIFKDVTQIYLQDKKKPIVVEITNKQIADTFKAYFEDYWKNTKKFK